MEFPYLSDLGGNACFETLAWLEILPTILCISENVLLTFFLLSEVQRSYWFVFLFLCPDSPEHQVNGHTSNGMNSVTLHIGDLLIHIVL